MSGGVDSSVAAALLKEGGHDVIGVTFLMFDDGVDEKGGVAERAEKVAEALHIPHRTIAVDRLFDNKIISYFIEEYLRGKTPVPCVLCNKLVKFDRLIAAAEIEDCRYIATGHYVRIARGRGGRILKRGIDAGRDQSYFLSRLGQEELKKAIFPLGDMLKEDVMKIAADMKLPISPGESREICFVAGEGGEGDYRDFIEANVEGGEEGEIGGGGEIVDLDGKALGEHNGYHRFTVGQRRGIGIPSTEPLYVVKIDAETKRVFVGRREDLYEKKVSAGDFSWIAGEAPVNREIGATAMIRYNQKPGRGTATIEGGSIVTFTFDEPQFAPAPGQVLALYDGDTLLGGGFIL